MTDKYILNGKMPQKTDDILEWARKFVKADRRVASDFVGKVHISTVFLSLDHSFGSGPPLLFETMIFGGPHDGYQERCSTWNEAEAEHAKALALVQS